VQLLFGEKFGHSLRLKIASAPKNAARRSAPTGPSERLCPRVVPGGTEGLRHRPRGDRQVHILPELLLHVLSASKTEVYRTATREPSVATGLTRPSSRGGAGRGKDLLDEGQIRDPHPLRHDRKVAVSRRKARERVALDEVRRPGRVETEIDPREVAASEGPVDPSAHRSISERTGPGSAGGTRMRRDFPSPSSPRASRRTPPGRPFSDDLHHPGDPGRIVPQHSHRDLRPRHERLDQRLLAVRPRDEPHHLPRLVEGRRARCDRGPFAGSLEGGFDDDGKGERRESNSSGDRKVRNGGVGIPRAPRGAWPPACRG